MPHTSLRDLPKRAFDVALASIGLLIALPFLAVIAVLIKLASPGPVLYRGVRVGYCGQLFEMLKFRTMVVDAESRGGSATAADDPRITGVGTFLRRYKLDELPQLINVLKGEMSFVGPRPEVQKYMDMLSAKERIIVSVRPGITDWASIWNSNEAAVLEGSLDPERTYEQLIRPTKIALQLLYIRDHSLATDLKVLFHTGMKLLHENWMPKELKPYGKIRTYRMVSEVSNSQSVELS